MTSLPPEIYVVMDRSSRNLEVPLTTHPPSRTGCCPIDLAQAAGFSSPTQGLWRQQHTLPEKSHMSSAIHLPFEHFETIALPLNWPRAPTQGEARFDGIIIRP